jgi:hypothetical protein
MEFIHQGVGGAKSSKGSQVSVVKGVGWKWLYHVVLVGLRLDAVVDRRFWT